MEKDYRSLRLRLGLNQEDFWRRVGITQSGGSRYETGRRVPVSVKILLSLAYGTEADAKNLFDQLRAKEKAAE